MANASAKRIGSFSCFLSYRYLLTLLIASQNEVAIKNMLYGQLLCNLAPTIIRILFRGQTFRDSKKAIIFYFLSLGLSQFLYQHLKKLGTPRRDSTGNLVSPGDDLNQPGMTEWIFDILYISCESIKRTLDKRFNSCSLGFAQVGASILGEWFWWIYLVVFPFLLFAAIICDA